MGWNDYLGYGDPTDDYFDIYRNGYPANGVWNRADGMHDALGEPMSNVPTPEEEALMQQAKEEAAKRAAFQQKAAQYFPQQPAQGGLFDSLMSGLRRASNNFDDILKKDNERWQGPGKPFPRDPNAY